MSTPTPIRPKISNDFLEKLRVKFLDTRSHELESGETHILPSGLSEEESNELSTSNSDRSVQEYKLEDFENLIYVNSLAKRPNEAEQAFQMMEVKRLNKRNLQVFIQWKYRPTI